MSVATSPSALSRPTAPPARRFEPVTALAVVGAFMLVFIVYVLIDWVTGPDFGRVHPPPGVEMSDKAKIGARAGEILSTAFTIPLIWFWIIKPKLRDGTFSLLGLISLASATVYILDPLQNYWTFGFSYNSELVSWGSWSNSFPGFGTPNMGQWPENPLMAGSTYIWFNFAIPVAFVVLWRWMDKRFEGWSAVKIIIALLGAMAVVDAVMEGIWLRFENYGYPGAVSDLSLFGGHYYQYPIYVGLTTAFFWFAMASLVYYVDDRGNSWAERGIDKLRLSDRARTFVRFLALTGACHIIFIVSYFIPSWFWYSHGDGIPVDTKDYMVNGACGKAAGFPCPGSNLRLPRGEADAQVPSWVQINWDKVPYKYSRDPNAPDAPK